MRPTHRHGFTLIELSIVLVIIGLIVSGVLVGKELINAAKIRKEFSQIEKLDTAVNTFRLKYGALPGDIANPTTYGLPGPAGNNDRRLQGANCIPNTCISWTGANPWNYATAASDIPEWAAAQTQLRAAGLSEYGATWTDLVDFMATAQGGVNLVPSILPAVGSEYASDQQKQRRPYLAVGYESNNRISGHYFRPGMSGGFGGFIPYRFMATYVQTPAAAFAIDQKFDDGNALGGRVMAAPWMGSGCKNDVLGVADGDCSPIGTGGTIGDASLVNRCLLDTTLNYDTAYNANTCALRVKASF